MRPLQARTLAIALLLMTGIPGLAPRPAAASVADVAAMPHGDRFGCLNCHNGSGTTLTVVLTQQANQLNDFGLQWLANGSKWNKALAQMNADGDGCLNGFEVGDPGGKWVPGMEQPSIASDEVTNPGDGADCVLPINENTWGVLKSLFGD